MADTTSDVVLHCDADGTVTDLPEESLQGNGAAWRGRRLVELVRDDDRERVRTFVSTLRTVGLAFEADFLLKRDDGATPHYAVGVHLADDFVVVLGSSPQGALRKLRDVVATRSGDTALLRYVLDDRLALMAREGDTPARSETVRSEGALEEIVHHERQRDEFVSMAAHELRNPLATIRFYAGCLLDLSLSDEEQRAFVSIIQDASSFMGQLIEEMLTVSAVEAGQWVLDRAEADVCEVTRRCCDVHRPLAEKKQIRIDFVPSAATVPAVVDADKVAQVVGNLLSNAVKFSEAGTSVVVHLSTGPGSVRLAVEDQGPGIPADEIPLLFRPFQRTSVRSTAGERSTGLGLAICRSIVDRHGGQMWVESEVGRGSTFFVELPSRPEQVLPVEGVVEQGVQR